MPLTEEEQRRIIDLHFHQRKPIREVSRIMGKSSHDITPVTKEYRIRLTQDINPINKEQNDDASGGNDRVITNVQAYKLFSEGKTSFEVTAELNLPGPEVQQFYIEYLNLMRMDKLVKIYKEIKDSIGYFLKLFRLGKREGLTPERIILLVNMAYDIHDLEEKYRQLQAKVIKIDIKKSVDMEQLETLHNDIEAALDKLTWADTAFKLKYEETSEVCTQIRMLEKYVKRFKNGEDYVELEAIVKDKVGEFLYDNKRLLESALASVVGALQDDPDRYILIDRMQLTPFTNNTIINYSSFLESRRPSRPQGDEQFVRERTLEKAARILDNLQKGVVDNIISTAAGLEKGGSNPTAYQSLPYYELNQ
jgi:hypothetical protein